MVRKTKSDAPVAAPTVTVTVESAPVVEKKPKSEKKPKAVAAPAICSRSRQCLVRAGYQAIYGTKSANGIRAYPHGTGIVALHIKVPLLGGELYVT